MRHYLSYPTIVIGCVFFFGLSLNSERGHARDISFKYCNQSTNGASFYGSECTFISAPTLGSDHIARINVLRARAFSAPKSDPLVVITGGPGTAAVNLASQYLGFFSEVRKDRDILFIDQRGTGKSEPFNCKAAAANDNSTLAEDLLVAQMQTALRACAAAQTNINAISTHQAALDIEQVRKLLGYTKVNLWGSSYGTRVALEYERLFPSTSRTVIVDGVAPAIISLPRYAEQDAGRALKEVFDACSAQPDCKTAFGNLNDRWQQLISDLNTKNIEAKFQHPRTQAITTMTISAALVANWVRFALYNRELSALLPLAIQGACDGNFQPLANLAQTASDSVEDGISHGMHAAILCAEDQHAPLINRPTVGALPAMPFSKLNDLSPVCQAMPAALAPVNSLFEPVQSTVPTLVLSGQFDPVTPAFWGDWAKQQLSNSQHWIIKGGHHGVSGLGCMPTLLATFIKDASFNQLKNDCLDAVLPTSFFIDIAGPGLQAATHHAETNQATTGKDGQ